MIQYLPIWPALLASAVLEEIRRGIAHPDAIANSLADLLGIDDVVKGAAIAGFCRAMQKVMERVRDHG